ncbi:MAG TPA: diacylglycerol kinase family protein [Pseudonocardiaceae bacterium]|nr:diacylglycerol kinase family protein [Pseudonocardiaceae bacterium]
MPTQREPAPNTVPGCPLPAVVVNPSNLNNAARLRTQITRVCRELEWADPLWLETTVDDPGGGQAKAALAAGADVVLACGGDGTVRQVAQILAGTGTAIGLLPTGTANLLARNLTIPLDDLMGATRIALSGDTRTIDVGWVTFDQGEEHVFLVMAGMGFDAAIMAGAHHASKTRLGALAYFVSGMRAGVRALSEQRVRIVLAVDGRPELHREVRTVVVGNCGKLLGGLVLMPGAKVDDGLLDVVTIAPKSVMGWVGVTARVLSRRPSGHRIVQHWQGRSVTIIAEEPEQAQLDGDPVGDVQMLRMRADERALLVRVRSSR